MKKIVGFFLFFVISFFSFSMDKIIILNSYGEEFQWTSDEVDGILDGIGSKKDEYDIFIEYMDWKKEFGVEKYNFLKNFYYEKYEKITPKLIIITDNIAYNMAKDMRKELFKNEHIPIVFCGINGIRDNFSYEESKSAGIAEVISLEDTISMILQLHRNLDTIYIVNDKSETGQGITDDIKKIRYFYKIKNKIKYIKMKSKHEFIKEISLIKPNSVIIQGVSNNFEDGTSSSYENSLKIIKENSNVPIYSFWTFLLDKGIVGGKLLDGKENGRLAGEIAKRILEGEAPEKISLIEQDTNKFIFDYKILKKYKINIGKNIKEYTVINKEESILKREIKLYLIIVGISFLIAIILIMLMVRIRYKS